MNHIITATMLTKTHMNMNLQKEKVSKRKTVFLKVRFHLIEAIFVSEERSKNAVRRYNILMPFVWLSGDSTVFSI